MDEQLGGLDAHVEALTARLAEVQGARPVWWQDAEERDERAAGRDAEGRARDEAARQRDLASQQRDVEAADRERAAVELTSGAHDRLARLGAADGAVEVAHAEAVAVVNRAFDELGAFPEVPPDAVKEVRHVVELVLDRSYATLLAVSFEREEVRKDLRDIGQHLQAATRDRLAAGEDRAAHSSDRTAAGSDRQHALSERQAAALDRAAES